MQIDCFPDLAAAWPKRPISKLAKVNPRYSVKKGKKYPFIEMAAVGENFAGIARVEWRTLEGSGLSRFKVGDTLFAKITPCPQNGKVAFVRTLPDDVGLGSTEFIVLSPISGADPRFLFHLVCSHAVRGRAAARMEGSTGRQRVPEDVFTKWLLVPIPDVSEQSAISQILDAVDSAIEHTRVAVDRASDLEKCIIADAFEALNGDQRPLGDFAIDIRYGTSNASSDRGWGDPILRIPNVVSNRLLLDDLATVELPSAEVSRLELQDGDLLLVRTNGNPNYVGRSVVFRRPNSRTWVYASYLIRVRIDDRLLPDFVNVFLGTERGRRQLLRRVTTSAGNHNINSNSIRLISIPVPRTRQEQDRIIELARASRAHIDALQSRMICLLDLKKSLTQDLLTGVKRVKTREKVEAS